MVLSERTRIECASLAGSEPPVSLRYRNIDFQYFHGKIATPARPVPKPVIDLVALCTTMRSSILGSTSLGQHENGDGKVLSMISVIFSSS